MSTPAFTFTADGVVVKVFAVEVDGGVKFTFETELADGYRIDLNGFFLDIGGDGGSVRHVDGQRANNMNGGNNNGYDHAVGLGSVGGKDADWTSGSVIIPGITLADLEGADAGLRATSYGLDGEGSLKLTADYTPPEEPPPEDHFPLWGQDISNVILVFKQDDGDTRPRPDGDGYYTVKIDEWPNAADDDLDNSIADILAWLVVNDPHVDADSDLLGVIIKGGVQDTNFYAYGDNNTNGTAPDPVPDGLALSWSGSANPQPANAVDASYNYDLIWA